MPFDMYGRYHERRPWEKKHTLIVHHVDDSSSISMAAHGTTPRNALLCIIDYLHTPKGRVIDDVILTRSEDTSPCDTQAEFLDYCKIRKLDVTQRHFNMADYHLDRETAGGDADGVKTWDWKNDLTECQRVYLCGNYSTPHLHHILTEDIGLRGLKTFDGLVTGSGAEYKPAVDPAHEFAKACKLINAYERTIQRGFRLDVKVKGFTTDFFRLRSERGFQLFAKYMQGDQHGVIKSSIPEFNEVIDLAIRTIDFNGYVDRKDCYSFKY